MIHTYIYKQAERERDKARHIERRVERNFCSTVFLLPSDPTDIDPSISISMAEFDACVLDFSGQVTAEFG